MSSGVRIRVTRACWHAGVSHPAGATLTVEEEDALDLLASGRTELVDERDRPKLKTYAIAAVRKALRAAGPLPAPPAEGPWIKWGT